MSPRRLALLHPNAAGEVLYGSDRVLLDHLAGLDRGRYSPVVVLPRPSALSRALDERGVPWRAAPLLTIERAARGRPLRLLASSPPALRQLDRVLSEAGVELVHSSTLALLGGALWSRWRGVPHLWHVQEIPPPWARPLLGRALAWGAGRIACNSAATATWVREAAPARAGDVRIVYPGRALEGLGGPPPERTAAESQACVGLLLGRLSPRKGHDLALDALEASAPGELSLWLAGGPAPGAEAFPARFAARLAASPRAAQVRALGAWPEPQALLAAADVILVPSRSPESFGLVALEAMLAGKPVLASDAGGLRELVVPERTGLLLPPEPAAWAAAWTRLARDPQLRAAWGAAGRERAARFTPAQASAGLCALYEELLGPAPGD